MNSKSIAGVLVASTLVLGGGSALAAMLPSHRPAHHEATRPASGGTHSATHHSKENESDSSSADVVTYTVQVGDTLPIVDTWLHHHGYGRLWNAYRSQIGSETHLLFPGERITIRNGVLTTELPKA